MVVNKPISAETGFGIGADYNNSDSRNKTGKFACHSSTLNMPPSYYSEIGIKTNNTKDVDNEKPM